MRGIAPPTRPALALLVLATALVLLALLALAPRRAAAQAAAPHAARDLPRGAVLTAEDVEWRGGPVPSATAGAPGPGWVTRRVVRAGEALREPAVAPPELVRAGEPVRVVWQRGAVALSMRGTAARSAGEGQRVPVRIGTGWRLEGVVAAEGVVRIEPEQEGDR